MADTDRKGRASETDNLMLHFEKFHFITSDTVHVLSAPINYCLQHTASQEL